MSDSVKTPPTIDQVPNLPDLSLLFTTPQDVDVWGFSSIGAAPTLAWWHQLRAVHADTGLWPVIMDSGHPDALKDEYNSAWIVQHGAAAYDTGEDAAILAEMFGGPLPSANVAAAAELAAAKIGRWPKDPERYQHTIANYAPSLVALVPAAGGWEVPGVIGFGAFNDCPLPSQHVAALRHWHARYGAELCAMSHASLEFIVSRPPTTRPEAVALAREQIAYGNEAISPDSLADFAATYLNATIWQAWWD